MGEFLGTDLAHTLAQAGILGLFCSIFYAMYRGAIKELKECNEARISDVKTLGETVKGNTEAFVRFTETLADTNRAREAVAAGMAAHTAAIGNLVVAAATKRDVDTAFERLEDKLTRRASDV